METINKCLGGMEMDPNLKRRDFFTFLLVYLS